MGFVFLRKKCEKFFLVMERTRYRLSLVFRLSLVSSKFKFSALKTNSHGKSDLKNLILGSDLRHNEVEVEFRVQDHPVFQHLPVLCGYSTFGNKNHFMC